MRMGLVYPLGTRTHEINPPPCRLDHLAAALAGEPWARVVKLSDFTDNGVGIIHTAGPKVLSSARKYTGAVPILRDRLDRPDTPLAPAVKDHVRGQLALADERFAAILAA